MNIKHRKIIIFDRNSDWIGYLRSILSREGCTVFSFDTIANCLDNIDQLQADLIILGPMPEEAQMLCVNALMAIKCPLPLLLVAKDSNLPKNLASYQCHHADIIAESFEPQMLRSAVQSALEKSSISKRNGFSSYLVGNSPDIIHIKQKLTELGRLNDSILIMGESGTGKEDVARAVHSATAQNGERFIKIGASELNGIESFSLLFEFKKRQLLPDDQKCTRRNHTTGRWSIYLDEIGRLPCNLQAELLLFTEAANNPFRIIAGTSQDIETMVADHLFRKDLFYRLNVIRLKIPPLRHRKQDINWLSDFFFYKFYREFDKASTPMSNDLKRMFLEYHWPGNVTEMRDFVKQTVQNGVKHKTFEKNHAKDTNRFAQTDDTWANELISIHQMTMGKEYLDLVGEMALKAICADFKTKIEKQVIRAALESTNWNRKQAAATLCISYKSMLNKIKAYGLA